MSPGAFRASRQSDGEKVHGADWYRRFKQLGLNEEQDVLKPNSLEHSEERTPVSAVAATAAATAEETAPEPEAESVASALAVPCTAVVQSDKAARCPQPGAARENATSQGPGTPLTVEDVLDEERTEHRKELRQWYDVLFEGPYELKYPAPPTGPVRAPGRTHPDMARSNPHTRHLLADLDSDLGIGGSLRGTYYQASRQRRKQLYQGSSADSEENSVRGGHAGYGGRAQAAGAVGTSSPAYSEHSHAPSSRCSLAEENEEREGICISPTQGSVAGSFRASLYPIRSEPSLFRREHSDPHQTSPLWHELDSVEHVASATTAADSAAAMSSTTASPASLNMSNLQRWLAARSMGSREPIKHRPHWVFVYGTLKRGYPNHPLLHHAIFEGCYVTIERYPLIIGGPHFTPFLLSRTGVGKHVRGEVYRVDDEELAMLDVLENVGENYHRERTLVRALADPNFILEVFVYLKCNYTEEMLHGEFLEEYTDTRYVPRFRRKVVTPNST